MTSKRNDISSEPFTRSWRRDELDLLACTSLIRVAAQRADSVPGRFALIGHVRVDGDELIRSLRGVGGAWYRGALRVGRGQIEVDGHRISVAFAPHIGQPDVVDDAYLSRYGNDSGVRRMTRSPARDTTLAVRPLQDL